MNIEGSHKSYRPLTVATFRLNYMLHELQPLGYHLVNVLLHSAVCYLYVLLCGVVFSEVWPALIAGLLFAVHPIHTEAVSNDSSVCVCHRPSKVGISYRPVNNSSSGFHSIYVYTYYVHDPLQPTPAVTYTFRLINEVIDHNRH